MNSRKHPSLLAGLSILWLLLAAPTSAHDGVGSLHPGNDGPGDADDQLNTQRADGHHPLYAWQGGDRDLSRELAAYQRTRNEEERQESVRILRERTDDANRYYWWWPFRR